MIEQRRLVWIFAHTLVFFLSFPQILLGWSFDFGLGFVWLVPTTLLLVCKGTGWWKGALWAGLAGWLAHSLVFYWVYVAVVRYGGASPPLGVLSVVLLAVYGAFFSALLGALAGLIKKEDLFSPLLFAAGWVVTDWLRSLFLTGFPWASLGYALHGDTWARSLVAFSGVYGLSFLGVIGGFALKFFFEGRFRLGVSYLLVVLFLHGVGFLLTEGDIRKVDSLKVGIVQGNIDQGVKWDPVRSERILQTYEKGTLEAIAKGAEIVLWPETAVPGIPEGDPALLARIRGLAERTRTVLIVGAIGFEGERGLIVGSSSASRFFDSALLVNEDGFLVDRYDKAHLVPFGEYIPFRKFLGKFVSASVAGVTATDVTSGSGPRVLRVSDLGPRGLLVGTPICYELLFPSLVRGFAKSGASFLTALTNDAWYGMTGAPRQFLAITTLRAIETGLWTVRAANTGISAFIAPDGTIISEADLFRREVLVEDIYLPEAFASPTFYVRYGDVFVLVCAGFLLIFLFFVFKRGLSPGSKITSCSS